MFIINIGKISSIGFNSSDSEFLCANVKEWKKKLKKKKNKNLNNKTNIKKVLLITTAMENRKRHHEKHQASCIHRVNKWENTCCSFTLSSTAPRSEIHRDAVVPFGRN